MQFLKTLSLALSLSLAGATPLKRNQTENRYAILDNDWSSAGFIPFLLAADAGIEILALTSCMYPSLLLSRDPWLTLCSHFQHLAETMRISRPSYS